MVKFKQRIVVLLIVAAVACSANTAAYKTVGALVSAVDLSMNGWGEYVRAERAKVPVDPALAGKEAKVRKAFEDYQTTIRAAKGALNDSTWNGTAPTADLSAAATALLNLIQQLRK